MTSNEYELYKEVQKYKQRYLDIYEENIKLKNRVIELENENKMCYQNARMI